MFSQYFRAGSSGATIRRDIQHKTIAKYCFEARTDFAEQDTLVSTLTILFFIIYIYRLIIILIGGGYPMRVHDVQVGYTSQALSGDDGLHVITGGNLS